MGTTTGERRRAPGMTAGERRNMIVRAALPLVLEHGSAVTTAQVARAAGIGEATIFRVFPGKDALLDAVVAEALRPEHVVQELASIALDQPLAGRLADAAAALRAYLDRMGAVLGALRASGHELARRPLPLPGDRAGRRDSFSATRAAVAELFEPDRAGLRLPPDQLAEVFLRLQIAAARQPEAFEIEPTGLVEVFLHGALAGGGDR